MADPHSHLFEVELRVESYGDAVELSMPAWTPGSYLLREFARHVQDFEAVGADGAPLEWRKTDRLTWRVETAAAGEVVARYRVYANELTVRTSHLDGSHAYVNGASVFMFARGREQEAIGLAVLAPDGWRVSTALAPLAQREASSIIAGAASSGTADTSSPLAGASSGAADTPSPIAETSSSIADSESDIARAPHGEPPIAQASSGITNGDSPSPGAWSGIAGASSPIALYAGSYDELVDSPMEIGTHLTVSWEQAGVPHEFAIWGHTDFEVERLVGETRALIDTTREMFGGELPYERFVFILHVVPGGRGGLEHRASTSLLVTPKMTHGAEWEQLISLVSHEFFHVWNGKRIRPAPLGPFDYTRENHTRNLWVVEGITTYYTDLLMARAGVMSRARYLARLAESISRFETLPGRLHQTLEEASFDTWIRFYRPDEHTPNSQISYYQKGALVALLLDMEIRRATGGGRSLDDVMRVLWERFGKADVGFPEDPRAGIEAVVEEVAGVSLQSGFDAWVRSVQDLDYARALATVGLAMEKGEPAAAGGPAIPVSSQERRLGVRTRSAGDRLLVTQAIAAEPGAKAGVYAGDELVAINGVRATQEAVDRLLERRRGGEHLRVLVFRRDRLHEVEVELGDAVRRYRIVEMAGATPGAVAERNRWLGG